MHSSTTSTIADHLRSVPEAARVSDSMIVSHAKGSWLWDADGERYVDFASGVLVLAAGHADERIADAIATQARTVTNVYAHDTHQRSELADAILATTGGDFDQAFFMSTGSEGIETALKLARAATGKQGIITFSGAFHGKTSSGVAMDGQASVRDAYGGTIVGPVIRARYPYAYRWDLPGDMDEVALMLLEAQIQMEGPERLSAIVLEPFLGAGGVVPASTAFLRGIRTIADRYELVFILDEIQSGLGRGGAMWRYREAEVVPDILLGAKHLGGGLPIVAIMARTSIFDHAPNGSLTSTFGGNPLSAAAGLQMLSIIESDDLISQCVANSATIASRMTEWEGAYEIVGEGRAAGLSCGIELVLPGTAEPNSAAARAAKRLAAAHGLVTMPAAGVHGNVLRFGPALNIPADVLQDGLDRLEAVIAELETTSAR
ncbi:aspartate aminotransferase family protein [Microbacterium sp.]|uniref:aspartate aminotransferase family protein n=1 Tax=Microbacterium sp. TaxID=51671 RepID=UPI003A8CDDFF